MIDDLVGREIMIRGNLVRVDEVISFDKHATVRGSDNEVYVIYEDGRVEDDNGMECGQTTELL